MLKLYDFPKSSASFRVRLACALKGVPYQSILINFRENAQRSECYLGVNASGLVPSVETGEGWTLSQSIAILDYLDAIEPAVPLFPKAAKARAEVMEMALIVACDVHPLNNLRVLKYLEKKLGLQSEARSEWYAHWVAQGFEALEIKAQAIGGMYCYGDSITAADVCLVPQMVNARRFDVPLDHYPQLVEIDYRINQMPFVADALKGAATMPPP